MVGLNMDGHSLMQGEWRPEGKDVLNEGGLRGNVQLEIKCMQSPCNPEGVHIVMEGCGSWKARNRSRNAMSCTSLSPLRPLG